MNSALTGSKNVTLLETIAPTELRKAWMERFAVDATAEISDDTNICRYRCNDTGVIFFRPATLAGSDRLYKQLQQIPWYYKADKWEFRVAQRELQECRSILEVGCGTGEFLKGVLDGHEVEGVELNAAAAAQARQAGLNVSEQRLEDIAARRPGSFDAVCSFQVLEHVPDPASFIRSSVELVKTGGKIVFGVPNCDSYVGFGFDLLNYPPHHMSHWTADGFVALEKFYPIRVDKILYEPLSNDQVWDFLRSCAWKFRRRSPHYRWLFNGITMPVYKAGLHLGLRRLFKGHTLYAQFVRT